MLCTDRTRIDLAVDMASRVWCRSFKATRKNAQHVPGMKKKKRPCLPFCSVTRGSHCSDLLRNIEIKLVILTKPRLRLEQRDISNVQTTHCSNIALASLVVAGHLSAQYNLQLLSVADQDFNIQKIRKMHIMAFTGPPSKIAVLVNKSQFLIAPQKKKNTEKKPECAYFLCGNGCIAKPGCETHQTETQQDERCHHDLVTLKRSEG